MKKYKAYLGCDGAPIETHIIEAKNKVDAYYKALDLLNPCKGFNYVSVHQIPKSK